MVEVREASAHDAAPLVLLLEQLGYPSTVDELRAVRIARPGTRVLVAEDGGSVVGAVAVHVRHHFQSTTRCASVDVLIVGRAHRSHGVDRSCLPLRLVGPVRTEPTAWS